MSEDEALRAIHLAENEAERRARAGAIDLRRSRRAAVGAGRRAGTVSCPNRDRRRRRGRTGWSQNCCGGLPFELTARTARGARRARPTELAATRPMNRMLQGEVGSGKTIVAVLAMLQMVDAGYQCALLAPTEVLAAQHLRSIRDVLGPLAMAGQLGGADNATRVALLTGSMSPAQKKQVRAEIAGGEAGIVIGTHALLQDAVEFHQLGHGGGRRATPVRRGATRSVARQGSCRHHAAPAGDDRDADTAHGRADRLRRPGDLDAARAAARPPAHHHQRRSSSPTNRPGWTGPGSASARRSRPGGRPTWWRPGSTRPTSRQQGGEDGPPDGHRRGSVRPAAVR